MINTTVFLSGDITEIKEWLDTNASEIFDSITIDGTDIVCEREEVECLTLSFTDPIAFTIKLKNGTTYSQTAYNISKWKMGFVTDNGILLYGVSGFIFTVCATKSGELYGANGNGDVHKIGTVNVPTLTQLTRPTKFIVSSLYPVPYTNLTVSEAILAPARSQLGEPQSGTEPVIVSINNVNYVYDGWICLKE